MPKKLTIYCDGGSRGNPGAAAIGVVILNEAGETVHSISERIGESTNNIAEYSAVIAALTYIHSSLTHPEHVQFFLDSLLVVQQLNGVYKIKKPHLLALHSRVKKIESSIKAIIKYTHIPRELNQKADLLLNRALDS